MYEVFDSDGVLIGYVDIPLGFTVFDFDVMGNLISLDEDTEITPPVDDNPKTGVKSGVVLVLSMLLVAVAVKKRKR